MNTDIHNLSKWLNEEQTAPIDRQALARVLAMAVQPAPVQPAYKDSTPHLSVGESSFESWFGGYVLNLQCVSSKQMARDAYAAGMGDPLVTAAPVQQEQP